MSKVFYPQCEGQTKQEVIAMINDRLEDGTWSGSKPDIKKLTDNRMQKFVDEWASEFHDSLDCDVEAAYEIQESTLEELARELCQNFSDGCEEEEDGDD